MCWCSIFSLDILTCGSGQLHSMAFISIKLDLIKTLCGRTLLCMAVMSLNFLRAIYYVFEGPIWGLKIWKATGHFFFFFFFSTLNIDM